MARKSEITNILETAIHRQYTSKVWGLDKYSRAAYKIMMRYSGGDYPEIEAYRMDDHMSWKKAFERIDLLTKFIEAGNSYEEILEKDTPLWYDVVQKAEDVLEIRSLILDIKKKSRNNQSAKKEMEALLDEFKKVKDKMIENRKKINTIYENMYRYAFVVVFERRL